MALEFHKLEVASVSHETEGSVSIGFDVPETLSSTFRFLPGQHVTVRAYIDGQDVRRSYSICESANSGRLRIGIKHLTGGAFSTFATTMVKPGDHLEVMPPVGEFTIEPDADSANHYAAIAAGSGVTPILSLVSTTLESEPQSTWTVILGNRAARTIMFLDELAGLKDRYPDRLHLIHVLSREEAEVPLFTGRIDEDKLHALFGSVVDPSSVDRWFLCGPFAMVQSARTVIEGLGIPGDRIADELFFAGPPEDLPPPPPDDQGAVALQFTLEGRTSSTRMDPDRSILDAALQVRRELPYSCRGGMCASCKAHLVEGEVRMSKNYALVQADLDQGFILTCQAHPTTASVTVDYDKR